MSQHADREWVRNHKVAGFVAGRFTGEYEGEQHDLVAVQSVTKGLVVLPAAGLIPVDKEYLTQQAGLDLERVVTAMREGGLDYEDMYAAWERAVEYVRSSEQTKS